MDLDARRRRLVYRASHRGTKEMDLILGRYAEARAPRLAQDALAELEALIELPDQQLYDWIAGREPVPSAFAGELLADLKRFCAEASTRYHD